LKCLAFLVDHMYVSPTQHYFPRESSTTQASSLSDPDQPHLGKTRHFFQSVFFITNGWPPSTMARLLCSWSGSLQPASPAPSLSLLPFLRLSFSERWTLSACLSGHRAYFAVPLSGKVGVSQISRPVTVLPTYSPILSLSLSLCV